ncbi:MAG: 2OG-Fe(II) oxygenase [Thiothrix sp.]
MEQLADRMQVSIEREGVADTLETRLLVVSDGRDSGVREALGIETSRREYHQTALIANVTTAEPHRNTAYERFTPNGPLALLPLTEGRYSLVWTHRDEDVAATLALDDADFLHRLQLEFGYRQGMFTRVGQRAAYPLVLQKAVREVAGRAVVIGNASHALHPVSGQGLNLGLRDVAQLAELLAEAALVGGDPGAAELLARYQALREPDQQGVLRYTDTLVRVFSNDFAPLAHARAAGLLAVDRIAPLRHWNARQGMGMRQQQSRLARGLGLTLMEEQLERIADALADTGWIVLPEFLSLGDVRELRTQAQAQWQVGGFHAAGIGRGQALNVNEAVRSDQVQWLERASSGALADYQAFIEALRQNLNRLLYMGLHEFESHFAVYPPGAFYKPHVDNFRGTSARLLTAALYLNEGWQECDGGQLRFYTSGDNGGDYLDIFPHAGTLVLFLSTRFWHEVMPARRERFSITGWLRGRGGAL